MCCRNNGTSSPYSIGISHGMSYFFARAQCNDKCFSLLHNSISFLLPQNLLQCFPRLLLSIADIQMLEIWILKLIHSNLVLYFKTGYKVTHNSSITLESSHISGKTAWNRNFSIVTLNRCCRIWYDSGSGSFITIHHSTISSKRVFNRGRLSFFFTFQLHESYERIFTLVNAFYSGYEILPLFSSPWRLILFSRHWNKNFKH